MSWMSTIWPSAAIQAIVGGRGAVGLSGGLGFGAAAATGAGVAVAAVVGAAAVQAVATRARARTIDVAAVRIALSVGPSTRAGKQRTPPRRALSTAAADD